MKRILIFCIFIFLSSYTIASIPDMYHFVAKEKRVPAKLFYALALIESGSRVASGKKNLPWPWAVNYLGHSYFFGTREETYNFINDLSSQGIMNFDIGLTQINWKWHGHKFDNLWESLDPYTNLSVAAAYLREQYDRPECNDWVLAVGCYHRSAQGSKDKLIAKNYRHKVIKIWAQI